MNRSNQSQKFIYYSLLLRATNGGYQLVFNQKIIEKLSSANCQVQSGKNLPPPPSQQNPVYALAG